MRQFWPLLLFFGCTVGIVTVWNNSTFVRKLVAEHLESGDFLTFEMRYSAAQVLEKQRKTLAIGADHALLEPRLAFYPYLLVEVKFARPDQTTAEGAMLWSLVTGEMVLDTDTWELSHGFEDCINAGATSDDYRIIHALLGKGGKMERGELIKALTLEADTADKVLDGAVKKQLVIRDGNGFRLHFQDPLLPPLPQTRLNSYLVTKTYKHTVRVPAHYSQKQIVEHAQAAFGSQLAVRRTQEVFLPVFVVEIENPDGSILTNHWNALNGQRLWGASRSER